MNTLWYLHNLLQTEIVVYILLGAASIEHLHLKNIWWVFIADWKYLLPRFKSIFIVTNNI